MVSINQLVSRALIPLFLFLTLAMGDSIHAATRSLEHDIFWRRSPTKDIFTMLLWNMGEDMGEMMDDIEADVLADGDANDFGIIVQSDEAEFALTGGAKLTDGGRFGGGVELPEGGTVECADFSVTKGVRKAGVVTLDFWVRPAVLQPATLVSTLERVGMALQTDAEGNVCLLQGESVVLTNSRPLVAGCWSHVAVVLQQDGGARLSVDGWEATLAAVRGQGGRWTGRSRGLTLGGPGFSGTFDAVQVRKRDHRFYTLDEGMCDVAKTQALQDAPPFFAAPARGSFYCSLDRTLEPEHFAGLEWHGDAPAEAFVPGVRGQAFDLSYAGEAKGQYVGIDVIPQSPGSLEFWFRPLNWDNFFVGGYLGEGIGSLNLFHIQSKTQRQPYQFYRKAAVRQGRSGQQSPLDLIPIHPGRWTHVLITWGKGSSGVYLDGVRQKIGQVSWSGPSHLYNKKTHAEWKERTGGKQDGTFSLVFDKSNTLIDEIRAYPWAMRPVEAWNAYVRYLPDSAARLKTLPTVEAAFDYMAHDWENVEKLKVRVSCLPVEGAAVVKADLSLVTESGDPVASQKDVALDATGAANVIFRKAMDFGHYVLNVTPYLADGKPRKTVALNYERVRPEWYENQLGKERTVPKPWTPIKVAGNSLSIWGRTIDIGDSGLPAAITTLGHRVLAAPAAMRVWSGNTELSFSAGKLAFSETAEDRVAWQSTSRSGTIDMTINGWMEYDGLMTITVTLANTGEPVQLDKLQVLFPLDEEGVSQLIANGAGGNFRASWDIRMIPMGEGSVWNSRTSAPKMQRGLKPGSFLPHIWLGGDDVGLHFSGENDRGWTPDEATAAQEILRQDGNVVFCMNVISLPVTLVKEHRFHFIVTPTPTKPEPKGWRGWNRSSRPTPLAVYDVVDDFMGYPLKSNPLKPEPLNFKLEPYSWDAAAEQAKSLRDKFGAENPVFFYMDYSWPKPGKAFADWNHALWAGSGRIAWSIPEVEDYMVWTINEYIKRGLIDGIYVDDMSVGRTYSLAGTAYPWEHSKERRRQGFSTMGFRRFCQRVWKLFEAQGKEPHIMPHMTLCFEIPALSFCMAAVNGEARMIHPGAKHDTMNAWPRDTLRIMGNAPKWGFATFWKPTVEIQGMLPKAQELWAYHQYRTMHANVMQADMWYLWHYPSASAILNSLLEFGMNDADMRFIPYWKNDGIVTTEATEVENIEVGLFVKKGKVLMLVSNFSKSDQDVTLTVDSDRLFSGVSSVVWRDADRSLEAPEAITASAPNIGDVEPEMMSMDSLGDDDDDDFLAGLDSGNLEDALDGVSPLEKERERLVMHSDGNTVKLVVRKRDYRLLELRPAPGNVPGN